MDDINQLEFRKLDRSGVTKLVNWAKYEGWNPGPEDAGVFYSTDPDGYYGYFDDEELIAGGAIISYNGKYGFMGLFIVRPEYRGQGIGNALWFKRRDMLLSRLDQGAPIGMDGVVDMQPFYKKGGFEIAFIDKRFERIGEQFDISQNITNIENHDFEAVIEYDANCFGVPRPQFLIPWLSMNEVKKFKYTQDNSLLGFAILRRANSGYKIGPLFADNETVAEELYKACLSSANGQMVYLDISMSNQNAVNMVNRYNAKFVFECARMYYGKPLNANTQKVFGITTFELG